MAKKSNITNEQYDKDKEGAVKKQPLTMDDVKKNEVINFMSFYNFQLDVIKSNLIIPLNNIDKVNITNTLNQDDTKQLLDHLTNLGQSVIEFMQKYVKYQNPKD